MTEATAAQTVNHSWKAWVDRNGLPTSVSCRQKKNIYINISHGCSAVTPETVTFRPNDTTQNRMAKTIITFDVTVK